jgi:hypothetical protein
MSTFNAKKLVGLFLLILVSVGFVTNGIKELEKQKLGRLVESRCAIDGLSKQGCKVKLVLDHLEAFRQLVSSYSFGNSSESAQQKMELATIEKEEEAFNSLGDESNDLLTESDIRILFGRPVLSNVAEYGLMGTISMITREELVGISAAIEEKRIQLNNIGT